MSVGKPFHRRAHRLNLWCGNGPTTIDSLALPGGDAP
jgi:hypothetical protein